MAAAGVKLSRLILTYYGNVTPFKLIKSRIFINCSSIAPIQFSSSQDKKDNRSNNDRGNKSRFLLPVLLGFSLFGKAETSDKATDDKATDDKATDDKATDDKATKNQDILEDEVITVLKNAKLKEIKQEYPEAENFYHRALGLLNIYEQNKSWDKNRIIQARVYIFDGLANLALARGQLDKAEKLFKETLRGSLQQGMSTNHDAVVEISLKLAMIYAAQKKNYEANEGYRFCIKTQEEKVKEMEEEDYNSVALLGMALDGYAKFLVMQNRYDEAQTNLEKSLKIAEKVFGEDNAQVAVLLNDIATVSSVKQDYDLAKMHLERAVKIAETIDSPDTPTFYFNLGEIHEHLGNKKEAVGAYRKALAKAKKFDDKAVLQKATDAIESLKKI